MPTPSIQTLTTDAQQVLNLDSISAVRSVVAVALANANTGTPLNPNLTTQQLWDQFYQVVTRPKSDIESIIANQLMKFLYSPPAPGGAGADKQVIFNDGGVLAGDADFLWNKTTNLLTVTGAATITGDLTVRTNKLFVNATGVGIGNTGPLSVLTISSQVGARLSVRTTDATFGTIAGGTAFDSLNDAGNALVPFGCRGSTVTLGSSAGIGFQIDASGNATWSNVGGVAGTAMTLNATGLGVGTIPGGSTGSSKIAVVGGATYDGNFDIIANFTNSTASAAKGVLLGYNNSTNNGIISAAYGSGTEGLTFWTHNGSSWGQRMELTATGNLGIGVTPSAWTLKSLQIVAGGIYGSGNETGYYANAFYGSSGWRYINAAGASGYLQNGGSHQWYRSTSANVAGTDPVFSQAMTLDASGNLLVGVTSANASGGVLQLKSGITFPATQVASSDANTLDDYEEGTWTATLKGSVSDPTTPVTATGRYTKIGRQVSIQLFVNNVTTTGASGRIQIDGLPFANNGTVEAISSVGFYNMATFTGVPFGLTSASGTVVDMWSSVSAGVFQAVNYNPGSVQYVWLNLTYTV